MNDLFCWVWLRRSPIRRNIAVYASAHGYQAIAEENDVRLDSSTPVWSETPEEAFEDVSERLEALEKNPR